MAQGLWCDKYRPTNLNKLDFHIEQANQLKKLVDGGDFPHLFIYGPSGSGKRTRITCILKQLYGSAIEKLRIEHQTFQTPSNRKIEISTCASNYHIEVNPSACGIYDRIIIQELLKQIAQSANVTNFGPTVGVGGDGEKIPTNSTFKVVVITEADKLTKEAQHGLRRTMEKYMTTCRLILCGETSSRVTPAIKSRCLMIRVGAPQPQEIASILMHVAKKESMVTLNDELAMKIAHESGRNLRRALLMLETMHVLGKEQIIQPQWKEYINELAQIMLKSQTTKVLEEVRQRFYELQTHLIPFELVFKTLVAYLIPQCNRDLNPKLIELAAFYEHKMRIGSKPVYHFEAFIAQFMSIYNRYIQAGMDDDDDFGLGDEYMT